MTRFAIQRLREEKKMSQEELANKSGVSRTTMVQSVRLCLLIALMSLNTSLKLASLLKPHSD